MNVGSPIALFSAVFCAAGFGQALPTFLISNNDAAPFASAVTFYSIGPEGTPIRSAAVPTGGTGVGGGEFAESRLVVVPSGQNLCVFASNGGTGDIAGVDAKTRTLTGNFLASPSDIGSTNGIGLASINGYLYASYSTTSTIATFQIQSGCKLDYVSDLFAEGLNQGWVTGMAVHGGLMVVTYGDGSIESFNISTGPPLANNDEQYSTGYADNHIPNGVDITKDGHFAIFGDASTVGTVEVSDISSGLLAPTVAYNVGTGWNSATIRLSPDERTLFITNNSSGQVSGRILQSDNRERFFRLYFGHAQEFLHFMGFLRQCRLTKNNRNRRPPLRSRVRIERHFFDRYCAVHQQRDKLHVI